MPGLKLRAADAEDLGVMSAILQDSLVTIAEMAYIPEERRFALVANPFPAWEPQRAWPEMRPVRLSGPGCRARPDRIDVSTVSKPSAASGFHPAMRTASCSLLAVRIEGEDQDGGGETDGALILDFAGGSSVRLEVEGIMCHLDDLGEPWPTRKFQPSTRHPW